MTAPAGDGAVAGLIFNIQRYCLHDGAGIRTVVFLKGCPLACRWCANPESQARAPELALNARQCLGRDRCGWCAGACPHDSLGWSERGVPAIAREACTGCGACAERCPSGALAVFGRLRNVSEILDCVERDSVFYARSGGGLTLSGGEPLAQAEFALALLREARRRRVHTAIETCGLAPWPTLAAAAGLLREAAFDLKAVDPGLHRTGTGADNAMILANLARLLTEFPDLDVTVRTPVIPGFNDNEDEIGAILAWLAPYPRATYELLPYHRLGAEKYRFLDRPDVMTAAPARRFEVLAAFAASRRPARGRLESV